MENNVVLPISKQDLSLLQQKLASNPAWAAMLGSVPALKAAIEHPVRLHLRSFLSDMDTAVDAACENTNHPEDWDDVRENVSEARADFKRLLNAQPDAEEETAGTVPEPSNSGCCPNCESARMATLFSKACDYNYFDIPHLDFHTEGSMPGGMGIPGDSDGPDLEVCLDCARIINAELPLSDDELHKRIAAYQKGRF